MRQEQTESKGLWRTVYITVTVKIGVEYVHWFFCFLQSQSPDRKFIRVSASGGDINEKDILQQRVTDYIDNVPRYLSGQGKELFPDQYRNAGICDALFRTRNSYIGMCLTGADLEPLEEVIDKRKKAIPI